MSKQIRRIVSWDESVRMNAEISRLHDENLRLRNENLRLRDLNAELERRLASRKAESEE
jgi:hypothetical protein